MEQAASQRADVRIRLSAPLATRKIAESVIGTSSLVVRASCGAAAVPAPFDARLEDG